MDPHWIAEDILTIDRFFSADECDAYVKLSENKGFEEASVSTHTGMVMMKSLRNNDRVIIDDASLASDLWQRVQPFVPLEFKKWHPVGVNERFRFYRYDSRPEVRLAPRRPFRKDQWRKKFLHLHGLSQRRF
jgi:prolyl 4-hydroxylase